MARLLPLVCRSLICAALGAVVATGCGGKTAAKPPAPAAPTAAPTPPPAPAPSANPAEGIWFGVLEAHGTKLRIAFHIQRDASGALYATLDSLDQNVKGIPFQRTTLEGSALRLELGKIQASFDGTLDGDKLTGSWSQGGMKFPLELARVEKLDDSPAKPTRRPQDPEPPLPYREQEVSLEVQERPFDRAHKAKITLGGTLSLPEGKGPFPAVVLVTGSGAQNRDEAVFGHRPFFVLSDALVRRGIATLRFDDRGIDKSGGDTLTTTTLEVAEDVTSQLAWLAAHPEIDKRALGIIGHSEGGVVAPIVASKSKLARFIVMLAGGAASGEQLLHAQNALLLRAAGEPEAAIEAERVAGTALYKTLRTATSDAEIDAAIRAYADSDPARKAERARVLPLLRTPWFRAFLTLDASPYLAKVRVPVLAISGEKDLQVPVDQLPLIEADLRRAKNRDVTTKLLPGLNHLFQHADTGAIEEYGKLDETFAPEALQLIGDWIVERAARLRKSPR